MNTQPLITLSVIHYSLKDGFSVKEHLEPFFASVFAQTYKNIEILCVDNASTDEEAKAYLSSLSSRGVRTIFLKENIGTCAHNAVLPEVKGKYLWCLTMDTRYEPTFLEELVAAAEKHTRGGAFGGPLLSLEEGRPTNHIDSLGTAVNIWSSFSERANGKEYQAANYPKVEEVFGISGATVMYRMKALQDIALSDGKVWDERFFMYYEDVDICYRMQRRNWHSHIVHAALGYHVRSLKEQPTSGGRLAQILNSRKSKPLFYRGVPTRNKLWLLFRNHSPASSFQVHVATSLEVLGRLAFILLFERDVLPYVRAAWSERKSLEKAQPVPNEKLVAYRVEHFMRQ